MSTSTEATAVAQRTVLDRLLQSGIAEDRARAHIDDGWVRVDSVVVTDPSQPAEPPVQVEIRIIGPLGSTT
jgi:hypothetical protein